MEEDLKLFDKEPGRTEVKSSHGNIRENSVYSDKKGKVKEFFEYTVNDNI